MKTHAASLKGVKRQHLNFCSGSNDYMLKRFIEVPYCHISSSYDEFLTYLDFQ